MEILLYAIILGIVEGITEFLPISSTGHLILVEQFIVLPDHIDVMFTIVIQLGAIFAVIFYFRDELMPWLGNKNASEKQEIWALWKKTTAGVLPAIAIGGVIGSTVVSLLFNPVVVAVSLLLGGMALIAIEGSQKPAWIDSLSVLPYKTVVAIGFIQCLAMIPGTSRSAATIIGAMLLGCSRVVAAKFSFFLAIPTMVAATAYQLLAHSAALTPQEWLIILVGSLTAFFVAWAVIAFFMNYIKKNDFKLFGYYRIILGLVVLYFSLIEMGSSG